MSGGKYPVAVRDGWKGSKLTLYSFIFLVADLEYSRYKTGPNFAYIVPPASSIV
jgi:hypothetical protein